jgi:hypothetical protein
VVSVNGATRLIQGHEFFTQAFCELSVISIVPNLFSTHSRLNQDSGSCEIVLPLVLTSAITAFGAAQGIAKGCVVSGGRQLVPSRNMAQQRTNNLRATATIAIFLRDFLPPLIR